LIAICPKSIGKSRGLRELGPPNLFFISKFSDNFQIWGLNLQLFTINLQLFTICPEAIDQIRGLRELGQPKLIFDSTAEGVFANSGIEFTIIYY